MKKILICFLAVIGFDVNAQEIDYSVACAKFNESARLVMTQRRDGLTSLELIIQTFESIEEQYSGNMKLRQRALDGIMNLVERAYEVPVHESENDKLIAIEKFGADVEDLCNKDITKLLIYKADFGLGSKRYDELEID